MTSYSPVYSLPSKIATFIMYVAILAVATLPFGALAASSRPTCTLTVTRGTTEMEIKNKGVVLMGMGDQITIAWKSKNATKAKLTQSDSKALEGTETYTVKKTTTYSHTFSKGSSKKTCSVEAVVVSASIKSHTTKTNASKPEISGKASGFASVRVVVKDADDMKTVYTSSVIKVRDGKWKHRLTDALSKGDYIVEVSGPITSDKAVLATAGLSYDGRMTKIKSSSSASANLVSSKALTFAVGSIPLLSGGTAQAGESVPVSYLQITNLSKENATISGFWLKQNGSASTDAIVELSTVDDKGGSRAFSTERFKNGSGFAPTSAVFAPGEMKLFTIKATLAGNVSAYAGTQLMLDVTGIEGSAGGKGMFPIRGTTWAISY